VVDDVTNQTENNFGDFLSSAHSAFLLKFIEMEQAKEEAIISRFLAAAE
jgi:hypothetical protein